MKQPLVYLHGYKEEEQDRLFVQAELLKKSIYSGIDFATNKKILEIGCGVGAQTRILLKKFPHLQITGIDASQEQLNVARKKLGKFIRTGQVQLLCMKAEELYKIKGDFDGAFICWFLEHIKDPRIVLRSLKNILKKRAIVYITEIQNAGLFINPYSPNILKYWFEFNDFQWSSGGNPFMGAMLRPMLKELKFKNILVEPRSFYYDCTSKDKKEFFKYFERLLFSASEHLLNNGRITRADLKKVHREVRLISSHDNAVLQLDYFRATARV